MYLVGVLKLMFLANIISTGYAAFFNYSYTTFEYSSSGIGVGVMVELAFTSVKFAYCFKLCDLY